MNTLKNFDEKIDKVKDDVRANNDVIRHVERIFDAKENLIRRDFKVSGDKVMECVA